MRLGVGRLRRLCRGAVRRQSRAARAARGQGRVVCGHNVDSAWEQLGQRTGATSGRGVAVCSRNRRRRRGGGHAGGHGWHAG